MKLIYCRTIFTLTLASLFLLNSCTKKVGKLPPKEPEVQTCNVSFNASVKPVVDLKCVNYGCHGTGTSNGDFTTYEGIKPLADNGRIKQLVFEDKTMPVNCALTNDELQSIKCWLDNGAPNN